MMQTGKRCSPSMAYSLWRMLSLSRAMQNELRPTDVSSEHKADNIVQGAGQDVALMQLALAQAKLGAERGEVPVGAVLAVDGVVIAQGHNQPIVACDPTAHAEIVVLRAACIQFGNYRLPAGSTLYVTLEPCSMCMGALIHARLSRLVYATTEPRAGAVVSTQNYAAQTHYNHRIAVQGGVCAGDSSMLLKAFFKARR